MATQNELQILIILSLIPATIALTYSLTQVTEDIRNRNGAKKRIAGLAKRLRVERPRNTKP